MRPMPNTVALLLALLPWGVGHAHEAHTAHTAHAARGTAAPASPQAATVRLPDVLLTDQDGRPRRLPGEVVGDRVVLVSFVYTHCTTVCPVVSQLFAQVQDQLGSALEDRVRLVSLSVDPARDTPARLKAYAERHGARPGWLWLTGPSASVTAALQGFGTYSANYQDHPAVLLLGDGRTGRWVRLNGFADPPALVAQVRALLAARGGPVAAAGKE